MTVPKRSKASRALPFPRGWGSPLGRSGPARSAAIMARVAARPAHVKKMAWLMPRMAKAVPYLGYLLVEGTKPA